MIIRKAKFSDIPKIIDVEKKAWSPEGAATEDIMKSRIETFPDGVYVACNRDATIGVVIFEIVNYDTQNDVSSWYQMTDNGLIKKSHDPNGNTAFGVDISVVPEAPKGTGKKLLERVGKEIIKRNLKYAILGGRMPHYYRYAHQYTPQEYFNHKNEEGEILDPEIRFYLKSGLEFIKIIPNYFKDPASLNYGVLLRWRNPFYIKNRIIGRLLPLLLSKIFRVI